MSLDKSWSHNTLSCYVGKTMSRMLIWWNLTSWRNSDLRLTLIDRDVCFVSLIYTVLHTDILEGTFKYVNWLICFIQQTCTWVSWVSCTGRCILYHCAAWKPIEVCVCVCVYKNLTATTLVRNLITSCEPTALHIIPDYCNRLLTGCLHFLPSYSNWL